MPGLRQSDRASVEPPGPARDESRTTDAALLARADAEPAAFRELYDRYAAGLHGFLAGRVGNRDAALDLTAETFCQAWRSRHRFDDPGDGNAAPWLYGIARNVLRTSVRQQRLAADAARGLGLTLREVAIAPSAQWLDGLDDDLEGALAALPHAQRRAIELRVVDELPYPEIADRLDCTPQAARTKVSRGLARLRHTLRTPASTTPEQP